MVFQYALRAHRHGGNRAQDGFLRRPRRLLLRSVSGQRLRRQFCECLGEGPLQRAGVWPRGRFPAPELRLTRKAVCVGGRGEGAQPARHRAPRCSAGEAPGSGAAVSAFRVGSDGRRAGAPLGCRERGRGGLFRGHDPEARALCFAWSISGVYRLAPARPGAHGPSHRRDPESGASCTQASRLGVESRSSPNAQTTPRVVPARGTPPAPGVIPCAACLDTKPLSTLAMPHLLDLLCGITPRSLKTHARACACARAHTHTGSSYPLCFHCSSMSF